MVVDPFRLWSWWLRPVAFEVSGRDDGGCSRAEVGSVPAEDGDPLCTRLRWAVGDQVGGVEDAVSGHPDVRRRGAGAAVHNQVRVVDGLSLDPVHGGGVGELGVFTDVVGRQAG